MNIGNAADKLFCQEGWHRPALSLFAKVSLVFSCTLPKVTYSQKFAFAKRSGAMKATVGLLSGRTVCDSRWRGLAPTSSTNVSELLRRKNK